MVSAIAQGAFPSDVDVRKYRAFARDGASFAQAGNKPTGAPREKGAAGVGVCRAVDTCDGGRERNCSVHVDGGGAMLLAWEGDALRCGEVLGNVFGRETVGDFIGMMIGGMDPEGLSGVTAIDVQQVRELAAHFSTCVFNQAMDVLEGVLSVELP